MADAVTLIEAVGVTIGSACAIVSVAWKPLMRRHDARSKERITDGLFLHGSPAVPGVRGPLVPAGVRLTGVETGLVKANEKLDAHGRLLHSLTESVAVVSSNVEFVIAEVQANGGSSLHDIVARIEDKQMQVAEERVVHTTAEETMLAEQNAKLAAIAEGQVKVAEALVVREKDNPK